MRGAWKISALFWIAMAAAPGCSDDEDGGARDATVPAGMDARGPADAVPHPDATAPRDAG